MCLPRAEQQVNKMINMFRDLLCTGYWGEQKYSSSTPTTSTIYYTTTCGKADGEIVIVSEHKRPGYGRLLDVKVVVTGM